MPRPPALAPLLVVAGDAVAPWADRARLLDAPGAEGAVVVRAGDPPQPAEALLIRWAATGRRCVLVAAEPVTDTLKLVGPDGELLGTADRDAHRLVDVPLAAPLAALAAVQLDDPTPQQLLAALRSAGLPVVPA